MANPFRTCFWLNFPGKSGIFESKRVSKNIQTVQDGVADCTFCLRLAQNTMDLPLLHQTCDLLNLPDN